MYIGQFVQIRDVFNAEYDVNRQLEYAVVVGTFEHEVEVMFSDGNDALYHEDDIKPVTNVSLVKQLDKKFVRRAWIRLEDAQDSGFHYPKNIYISQNRE